MAVDRTDQRRWNMPQKKVAPRRKRPLAKIKLKNESAPEKDSTFMGLLILVLLANLGISDNHGAR